MQKKPKKKPKIDLKEEEMNGSKEMQMSFEDY